MKHVKAIRQQIETGQSEDALVSLENLLSLGPSNTEALKLQASIFHSMGRFNEEHKIWQRVLQIDRQDEEAISYFLKQQQEDREHFYFTDDLSDGGRRFIVYPKSLVTTSAVGLIGCLSFLIVSRMGTGIPLFQDDRLVLGIFALLVLLPWAGIIAAYLRSLRHIDITASYVEFNTRLKKHRWHWDEISAIEVAMKNPLEPDSLSLRITPRNEQAPRLQIDLSNQGSALRARRHFVRDINKNFPSLQYITAKEEASNGRRTLNF
jgi:hypothetical protein